MKTETQIAEENIELFKYCEMGEAKYYRMILNEHKASCQRFLEFLEYMVQIKMGKRILGKFKEKITDLKNAIKKYDEAGI